MIKKISIQKIATYPDTVTTIDKLKKVNFFFGSNGTGKTTISKVIANGDESNEQYSFCNLTWENEPLAHRVYNRDFYEQNFKTELKGVFTLGEENIEIKNKIETLKEEIEQLQNKINNDDRTLNGVNGISFGVSTSKRNELQSIENNYTDMFWKQKIKYAEKMQGAMVGVLNNKINFKKKILEEEGNTAELKTQEELEDKCAKIFTSDMLTEVTKISQIDFTKFHIYETAPILKKKVIGKEDVSIANLIKKLENSDWVREGKNYLKDSNDICPFCQQIVPKTLAKHLAEYFDETFENDINAIDELLSNYQTETKRILIELENIINLNSSYVNIEKLKTEQLLFNSTTKLNIEKIQKKRKEISVSIELDLIENIADNINAIISSANKEIEENNKLVKNIIQEKSLLTKEVWRFIVEEIKDQITKYKNEKTGVEAAILALEEKIKFNKKEQAKKKTERKELEKKTTDILATLNGINEILKEFGFTGFKLATNKNNDAYQIVREDGTDAYATLSEGEKNFVAFLYFYYLLKGNLTQTNIGENMIVVIDDPVSSLDSEVLFIVTTLIRNLIFNNLEFKFIKQVFVLTHNIYFYKSVSRGKNGNNIPNTSYYVVKKIDNETKIEYYDKNPIQSSYELLWKEITATPKNNGTIRNVMRRILESYFKLVGKIDVDKLYEKFTGTDKIMCQSLVSWLHDGSHIIPDDYETSAIDDEKVEKYMQIFKKIFIELGHENHYNLMTGEKENKNETDEF